jgi:hypothetical protein
MGMRCCCGETVNAYRDQSKVKMGICYRLRRFCRLFCFFPLFRVAVGVLISRFNGFFLSIWWGPIIGYYRVVMANEEDVIIYAEGHTTDNTNAYTSAIFTSSVSWNWEIFLFSV